MRAIILGMASKTFLAVDSFLLGVTHEDSWNIVKSPLFVLIDSATMLSALSHSHINASNTLILELRHSLSIVSIKNT